MLRLVTKGMLVLCLIAVVGFNAVFHEHATVLAQEEAIQLPDNYVSKLVYRPPLAGLGRITRSESGLVYIKHLNENGGVKVSLLNTDQDCVATVVDLPSWASSSIIIGGPGDTFFVEVDGEIRQVNPDGSFDVWGQGVGVAPWYYTPDGRMLGIAGGETKVVEIFQDGSITELATGLSLAYDIVADDNGGIFISDFMAESLIRLDPDGTLTTVASIAPDNTDLTIDNEGDLYLNNAASGFVRVDEITGNFTPMVLASASCRLVQSPADVVFDGSGRAIFASWVDSRITWVDFDANQGGELLHQLWANTDSSAVGPDDALYLGVDGCGTSIPGKIVRFTVDGDSQVYIDGLIGSISGIAFDSSGGLYVGLATGTGVGLDYFPPGSTSPSQISVPTGYDIGSLAVNLTSDDLFVSTGLSSPTDSSATILRFNPSGFQGSYVVGLPKPAIELSLASGPAGTLYAFATERDRFATGPEVDRWILRLELETGTSEVVAQVNRIGCCPMGSFSVDSEGYIWWVLNPDFLLYKVSPAGDTELFAENLPIDSGSVHRNSDGDVFLNSPEGIFRIWEPTDAERIQLVMDDLDELVHFGVLSTGHYSALDAMLESAIASLGRDQNQAAEKKLEAFLRTLCAYLRAGIIQQERADPLIIEVEDTLARL
jgi:sugar lactone lactonase YvrE